VTRCLSETSGILYEQRIQYGQLREAIQIILNIIGIAVVATLVSIFPFDFSLIPNATAVDVVPIVVTIVLVLTAVGLGIGAVVRFIKLVGNTAKQEPS